MSIICTTARRNLFRNARRTAITTLAISVGMAGLIFADAFITGMIDNMIRNGTASFTGDAQIHSRAYKEDPEAHHTIPAYEELARSLREDDRIIASSPRLVSPGLVSSARNSTGVEVWGVHPEREKNITRIAQRLSPESTFLPQKNSLVLGKKTAQDLNVSLGDHLIVSVADSETGERRQEYMRLDGLYSFGSDDMDGLVALIHAETAQHMLGRSEGGYTQVALSLKQSPRKAAEDTLLGKTYSSEEILFETWDKLMPQLYSLMGMTQWSMMILGGILFVIVAFTVINTLFMSIYERFFEFGVLKSLGTTRPQIIRMIIYEAGWLSLLSCAGGILLGGAAVFVVSRTGINWNDIEFGGMTIYEHIYPAARLYQFVVYPLIISALTLIISIYPALYIGYMSPSQAMKKSI
ncbi:ABC transporter permease [Chitinivibrio alkaliphilus]|uniref:ABC-type transport system involved in lipoprotein release, permease component n=1 Tax=Chitinivibrio alkaliphilus ACht1 TaxID=1313304 RepID=U7DCV9_9BACT|nr:FtsX-like permease family protein [Chitinivibrio alkaliphilus]ERP38736.1 ABC-type transport system involved in lipoprotein release, permease component [Chitinivibrio alkaliphilus ACht1]